MPSTLIPARGSQEAVEEPSPSPSLSADTSGGKVPQNIFTMVCEACRGGHAEDRIILCDRCDKGWHLQCLEPPLSSVPVGDWICPSCILEGDVGFLRIT